MAQISVIMPIYNAEAYLRRAVDSILKQTFSDFELLLVDDGSTDGSGEICDGYVRQDGRVRVLHQENAGVCVARNNGLDWVYANSGSQWLMFVDSDDWIHPELLQRLLDAAVELNVKISACGYWETGGEEITVPPESLEPALWTPSDFYRQRFINATVPWAKLYHRSCYETIRCPVGKYLDDEFVTYRLLFGQEKLAVMSAPLYAYFINPTGITKRPWQPKLLDAWEAYEQQITYFRQRGMEDMVAFRYRGYLENAVANYQASGEAVNAGQLAQVRKKIKKHIRTLLRRMWHNGFIQFWIDFDILYAFYPTLTRAYRLWLEVKNRLGGKADG